MSVLLIISFLSGATRFHSLSISYSHGAARGSQSSDLHSTCTYAFQAKWQTLYSDRLSLILIRPQRLPQDTSPTHLLPPTLSPSPGANNQSATNREFRKERKKRRCIRTVYSAIIINTRRWVIQRFAHQKPTRTVLGNKYPGRPALDANLSQEEAPRKEIYPIYTPPIVFVIVEVSYYSTIFLV